ncbi:MAG: DUF2201 family putative metallopeptidase [Gammaproteobacteria bacterium]
MAITDVVSSTLAPVQKAEPKDSVDTKLAAARTRLILEKPFLGALVLRLPLVEGDPSWCKSSATDAKKIYYNYDYIDALSLQHTQFILAHNALHNALSHFSRRGHRNAHRWDLACDFAINSILVEEGMRRPPDALYLEDYKGMTAEEIYPLMEENPDQEPLDQHIFDQDDSDSDSGRNPQQQNDSDHQQKSAPNQGQQQDGDAQGSEPELDESTQGGSQRKQAAKPPPLTGGERDELSAQWQQRLAGAAQQAMQAGKLSASMARLVDHLLQPRLPWRALLSHYLTRAARDDYSYIRPSSRREGPAIYPSMRSEQVDLVVALDTSGSISRSEVTEFISEINALKGQLRARVTIMPCDEQLTCEPRTFEPWEELDNDYSKELTGGRGTSFVPPFNWVAEHDRRPELMVYFTDAEGRFPEREPDYPVLWLVKGRAPVPWGTRIQLN